MAARPVTGRPTTPRQRPFPPQHQDARPPAEPSPWTRPGSFAGGIVGSAHAGDRDPDGEHDGRADRGANVVWWPGRPDPGCGQCWRVPLGLQPVDAHHQVARGPGPGQTATQRGGTAGRCRSSRPGCAARPGCRRPAALRSRRPSARLLRRAVSASAAASRKNGSHRPVWRSGLADRACGGDGDGHRGPGLEHQRQLQRAVGVPVPDKRDPQPDGAGRYCRRGRRLAACSRSSRIPAQGGRASPAVRPGAAVVGTVGAVRAVMAAVPG